MRLLTYSRNVFIPVTDLCRNRCGYCSFRRDPEEARVIGRPEALCLLERAAAEGCSEALFSLGECPWEVEGFQRLLDAAGVFDLVDYLVELCETALELGLLPHTNAGLMSRDELTALDAAPAARAHERAATLIALPHVTPHLRRDVPRAPARPAAPTIPTPCAVMTW